MGILAGFFIGLSIGLLLFHFVMNRWYHRQFLEKRHEYQSRILKQQQEIDSRQRHLNNYRFLEYNLSEVLVVQPQIVLP